MPQKKGYGHINRIPTPPSGEGDSIYTPKEYRGDPLYQILSKYLDGPFLDLYYKRGVEMRNFPHTRDTYEKGDGLGFKSWRDGLKRAMLQARGIQQD